MSNEIVFVVLYAAAVLYVGLAVYALTRPPNVTNRLLMLMMFICAFWAVAYKQELAAASAGEMGVWMFGRYLVLPFLVPLWFMLAVHLAGFARRIRAPVWCLLFLIPVLTALMASSVFPREWFRCALAASSETPPSALIYRNGPFGLIYEAYVFVFSFLGLLVLALALRRADTVRQRRQLALLLVSGAFPIAARWLFALYPSALGGIDVSPILLLPAFTGMAVAVFGFHLADAAPLVTRRILFDCIHDGVVVVSSESRRIIEFNRAAAEMLAPDVRLAQRLAVGSLPEPWRTALADTGAEKTTVECPRPGAPRWFERMCAPLAENGAVTGWAFVINDISDHVVLQARKLDDLRRASEEARVRQWGTLLRDLHDGVGAIPVNIGLLADQALKAADPAKKDELIAQIADFAADGNAELRTMMNMLEHRDLTWPDIFDEVRRFSELILGPRRIGFTLSVEGTPPGGTPPDSGGAVSLLRIVKEAVTNVAKHSGASGVSAVFAFDGPSVCFIIRDDGTWKGGRTEGRGTRHIRKRVDELGGSLDFQTVPATRLTCVLPASLQTVNQPIPP